MLLVVAMTGAPLKRLAELRIRHAWLLWVALADQILVISVIPDTHPTALAVAHIASYAMAAVCLVAQPAAAGHPVHRRGRSAQRRDHHPEPRHPAASRSALESSGHAGAPGEFANSAVLPDAKLAIFGDIFATPSWLPGHNVFSIGDVMIWPGWPGCSGAPAAPLAASVMHPATPRRRSPPEALRCSRPHGRFLPPRGPRSGHRDHERVTAAVSDRARPVSLAPSPNPARLVRRSPEFCRGPRAAVRYPSDNPEGSTVTNEVRDVDLR